MKDKEESNSLKSPVAEPEATYAETPGAQTSRMDLTALGAAEAALAEATSRVGDLRSLPSSLQQGPLLNWAERLTSHVTDGLREAVKAAAPLSSNDPITASTPVRRVSLLKSAVEGFVSVSVCHVECTEGYQSDAGGRIFESSSTKTCVEPRPLPASCVAVLMTSPRRSSCSSRIIFFPEEIRSEEATISQRSFLFAQTDNETDGRPLRIAACPAAPQLFLLTATQQRLCVRQCGLDGTCLQSAELKDFRPLIKHSADVASDEETQLEEVRGYEDARIEADAKHVVVFYSGSKASILNHESQVVVLLDQTSLRVLQRLQLPQESFALHATPRFVWLRQAGQLKVVSQKSRRVGREWVETDCFGSGGLFYAADATELVTRGHRKGKVRLAVASENCVRLFNKEMQPVGRISLRYPAAVCCCGTEDAQLLAVCDAAAHEVLLFRL